MILTQYCGGLGVSLFSLEMCPEYLKDQLSSRNTCKLIYLKEATGYSVINAIEGEKWH